MRSHLVSVQFIMLDTNCKQSLALNLQVETNYGKILSVLIGLFMLKPNVIFHRLNYFQNVMAFSYISRQAFELLKSNF